MVKILLLLPMYLDPGSGSLIAQLLAAGVLGAGVLIKVFWSKIKAFFSGKKNLGKVEELTKESEDD